MTGALRTVSPGVWHVLRRSTEIAANGNVCIKRLAVKASKDVYFDGGKPTKEGRKCKPRDGLNCLRSACACMDACGGNVDGAKVSATVRV